jgi:hypothetical protein
MIVALANRLLGELAAGSLLETSLAGAVIASGVLSV